MSDVAYIVVAFLLGTAFGLALSEVFAYLSYRVRYRATKKRKTEPLLGVVLPKDDN